MSSWDVQIGPIWNQGDAEKTAAKYIALHPGLKWSGQWNTTVPCKMSVIGVKSVGKVDVEVGPIWNQKDAEEKAITFIKLYPYLKWTGQWRTTVQGKMSVIEILAEKPNVKRKLQGMVDHCYPVKITFRIRNDSESRISKVKVSGIDDYDWGDHHPNQLEGQMIDPKKDLERQFDVNYCCFSAPFELKFSFENDSSLKCTLDGRAAIDYCRWNNWQTQWSYISDGDNAKEAYLLVNPFDHILEVVLCEVVNHVDDRLKLVAFSSDRVEMSSNESERIFWERLFNLLKKLGNQYLLPNEEKEFKEQVNQNPSWQTRNLIFGNRTSSVDNLTYYDVIEQIPDMLLNAWLIDYQDELVFLVSYAACTVLERTTALKHEKDKYETHMRLVSIWYNLLHQLWYKLWTRILVKNVTMPIAVPMLIEILANVKLDIQRIEGDSVLTTVTHRALNLVNEIQTLKSAPDFIYRSVSCIIRLFAYVLQMDKLLQPK